MWTRLTCVLGMVGIVCALSAQIDEVEANVLGTCCLAACIVHVALCCALVRQSQVSDVPEEETLPLLGGEAQLAATPVERRGTRRFVHSLMAACLSVVAALLLFVIPFCDLAPLDVDVDLTHTAQWYAVGTHDMASRCANCSETALSSNFEWDALGAARWATRWRDGAPPFGNASVRALWLKWPQRPRPLLSLRFESVQPGCRAHALLAGNCLDVRWVRMGPVPVQLCGRRLFTSDDSNTSSQEYTLYDLWVATPPEPFVLHVSLGSEEPGCFLGFRAAYLVC